MSAGVYSAATDGVSVRCSPGVSELVEELCRQVYIPPRAVSDPLVFSVDHCFSIRGQGTVMTGTVLQGSISVNQVRYCWDPSVLTR